MKNILSQKNARIFSAVICLILSLSMVFSLCSCKKNPDDGVSSSDYSLSSDATYTANLDDDSSDESVSSEESSSDESTVSDGNSGTVSSNSSTTSSSSSAVQQPTATNPNGEEIIGNGTSATPYLEIPDIVDDYSSSVKTVTIPAGKSVYYGIYRVGGRILTINSTNAYVVYNGTRYNANGGKVTFKVSDALASEAVVFEIGNTGSAATSFTLTFASETGSQANPEVITSLKTKRTTVIKEDDNIGYFYRFTATKDGTIRFYVQDTKGILSVTNNRNSAQSTSKDENVTTNADNSVYFDVEVKNGDELIINVGGGFSAGVYEAATVIWLGNYI